MKVKIIVDVMGGDNPPEVLVKGAVMGAKECGAELLLVGDSNLITPALDGFDAEIFHTDCAVSMEDDPMVSIRLKKNSSMSSGCSLLAEGKGDAFISCGNTGALYTAASHYVRCFKGLRRAALCAVVPLTTPFVIADAGANAEADANSLLSFARLGSVYCSAVLGIEKPRVALLNNGTESHKGTKTCREAYELLSQSELNFIGNCEGRGLALGECDVAVCDGFTGNIAIKTIEGMGKFIKNGIKDIAHSGIKEKIGGLLIKSSMTKFMKKLDATAYGGAPLLGISKPVMKMHGNADENTVKNGVIQAYNYVICGVAQKMADSLGKA